MEYRVITFDQTKNPATELQRIIDVEAASGWKYVNHEYSHYLRTGSAGCFGFGSRPDEIWHTGFVVFEKRE